MADETQTAPAKKRSALEFHPKMAAGGVAGALTAVAIYFAKLNGTDLGPIEPQLIIIISAFGSWLAPSA